MRWLKAQYDDIKGNFKWAILGLLLWLAKRLLQSLPLFPTWLVYTLLFIVAAGLFVYLAKQKKSTGSQLVQSSTTTLRRR